MMTYSAKVGVAPGHWHSPTDGPQQAASLGQHMNQLDMNANRSRFGGRFDHDQYRQAQQAQRMPTPAPAAPLPPPARMQLMNSVTTGTTPQPLYSQQHIQQMANRSFGQAMEAADPRAAQKQFMGRGLSLDEGTLASALPQIAGGLSAAGLARHYQPLQDQLNSQKFLLGGQQQQGQEFMGLVDLLRQLQGNQFNQQQMALGPLLSAALGGY